MSTFVFKVTHPLSEITGTHAANSVNMTKSPIDIYSWAVDLHKEFNDCMLAKQHVTDTYLSQCVMGTLVVLMCSTCIHSGEDMLLLILQPVFFYTWNIWGSIQKFPGCLEWELQMVQLSATRCSCITILWVSLVSFATITLCVASEWVFIVVSVYFVTYSVWKLLDTPNICPWCLVWPFNAFLRNDQSNADSLCSPNITASNVLSMCPWYMNY
jgi:hypothetical protein